MGGRGDSIASAEGVGDIRVGDLLLYQVWFVPGFSSTRLISLLLLDDEGYRIVTKGGVMIGKLK